MKTLIKRILYAQAIIDIGNKVKQHEITNIRNNKYWKKCNILQPVHKNK